jgi:hypothetical protein
MTESVPVTIYHNPACGTSRNTLGLIRNAGIEPTVIEYLKTPPDRATLKDNSGWNGAYPSASINLIWAVIGLYGVFGRHLAAVPSGTAS